MPTSEYERKRIEWAELHPGAPYPDDQDQAPDEPDEQ
jgi:hypothetical protein